MKIISTDLSSVDFEDDTFFIGGAGDLSSLKKSISELGLINPPVLRKKSDSNQIIAGRKRLLVCNELKIAEIPSIIYEFQELSDEKGLEVAYTDNKDRISEMELAELILKYRKISELDDRNFITKVLPVFDIQPSRKHYDRYMALAMLSVGIKNTYYNENITIEQAILLSELPQDDSELILNSVILKYKLNNNESKQVVGDISESALRDKMQIHEVISDIESNINSDAGDIKSKKVRLRAAARQKRFPDLSRIKDLFDARLKEMSFPENLSISHHPYFETNDLEIKLKFNSNQELFELLQKLSMLCEKDEIKKLLSLITEGK